MKINMNNIIRKKRDGHELSSEEIEYFIKGYTQNNIPDYQVAALLMAIYFNKMSEAETINLTKAMLKSGQMIDLSDINGIKVDKHSTGGVGDKTTLVLAPLVASCGLTVAKMSGRGLGHTGGTLDKLESIKGFRVELTKEEFIHNVNNIGLAVCGQTSNIAPADKKLYALRDVTSTVDNISLIASSIMSKKLASGSNAIVLDVKVGNGAFMKNTADAIKLAKQMVNIGISMDRRTIAVISDMNEPLGYAIGNSLEVKEAIETLKGNGPEDLVELCLILGSWLLVLGQVAKSLDDARNKLIYALESGKAYEKFKEFIAIQGGDIKYVEDTNLLPKAKYIESIKSITHGYISQINAEQVGHCSLILGAGRETKESKINLATGIVLCKKTGEEIKKGETLAYIHGDDIQAIEKVKCKLKNCIKINDKPVEKNNLIHAIIDNNERSCE